MIHHITYLGQPYALSTNALLAVLLSGARVQLASEAKGTPIGSQEPARWHGSEKAAPIAIPELERWCNSWIVSRKSGEVIGEFSNRASVAKFSPDTCFVETAQQYLARINGHN